MARVHVAAIVALLAATSIHGFSVTPYPASVLRSPLARHHAGHVQRARLVIQLQGWTESVDQGSGQTFYYNDETGESSWEPPPGLQQGGGGAMPGGWVAQVDQASGQTFYLNEQTGETQWEPPAATLSDMQQAVGAATGQALWRLAPYSGVCGFSGVSGFAAEAKYGNPSCCFYRLPQCKRGASPSGQPM